MRTFRDQPIRRKLLLIILAAVAATLLLVMTGIVTYEFATYRKRLTKEMTEMAAFIAANSAPSLAFDDPVTAWETLATVSAHSEIVASALYTEEGKVFVSNAPKGESVPLLSEKIPEGLMFIGRQMEIYLPVEQRGRRLGTLYLRVEMTHLSSRLAPYASILAVTALAIGAGAFLLQRLLQELVSDPLLRLSRTAERIAAGDLSARAPEESEDEIGQLAGAFNRMTAELAQSYAELEQRVEERTAELTEANRELEAFTYSVSHDLRAPLRHITGFVELLGADAAPNLTEQGQRYVGIIADSARRMSALIEDLLTFSRIGRAAMTMTTVDLRDLAEEARRLLAPETVGRQIEWNIGPLPRVRGDPELLRIVMVNLLSNAIKFTRHRSPARIEIGSRPEDGEVILFVRDNGAGFDMSFVDKLFGVFQRLHRAREFEGSGIGLASVRRIIQRHDGRTWGEGKVDGGATFYFSLPERRIEEV